MALTLEQEATLLQLFPMAKGRPDAAWVGVQALLDAERWRRGEADNVSGAAHALALTQGSLLREEYDLSTHGHHAGWVIGAVVVDIRALTMVNMRHGFPTGDAVLRATADSLKGFAPKAKVARIHSDAFAVLFGPIAEQRVTPELVEQMRAKLMKEAPVLSPALAFSLAMVELTLVSPSHWQVIGPLVWAECERALVMEQRAGPLGVQKRRIELDGAVVLPGM